MWLESGCLGHSAQPWIRRKSMVRVTQKPANGVLRPVRSLSEPLYVANHCHAWYAKPSMVASQATSLHDETSCFTRSGIESALDNMDVTPRVCTSGKQSVPRPTRSTGVGVVAATTFANTQQGVEYRLVAGVSAKHDLWAIIQLSSQ